MRLQLLMVMTWVEEDELVTLGCESLAQGQEKQEDAVGPLGELLVDPPQQQERQEEENLRP